MWLVYCFTLGSLQIQSGLFGDSDEIGLVLRYTDMENYTALVTNINERNVWSVIEIDGNKRLNIVHFIFTIKKLFQKNSFIRQF